MKNIKLFGDIAKDYKADWQLDVATPAEALRAINANRPGFLVEADQGDYLALLIDSQNPDNSRQVTLETGADGWGDEALYIVPRLEGEIGEAIIAAIGGSLLVTTAATATTAAVLTTLGTVLAFVINIAIAVAISAIATLISGTPDQGPLGATDYETPENKPSYLFNGVVNTAKQGHRIPVLYGGPLLVGSMVLSSRINTQDI